MHKSFLKWAGSKRTSISLIKYAVGQVGGYFIEPFAGSCVVSLNIDADKYLLADSNKDLIDLYSILSKEGKDFILYIKQYFNDSFNNPESFYKLRRLFNSTSNISEKAALFVYLNRHGFNGLCRYNGAGKFNVPFGKYRNPYFPEKELLLFYKKSSFFEFKCQDYSNTIIASPPSATVYCVPEDTLIYQDGFYLPIHMVIPNTTDLGNGNKCIKKHVRTCCNEELIKLNIMGISRHFDLCLSKNHTVFVYDKDSDKIYEKKAATLLKNDLLLIDYDKQILNDVMPYYNRYNIKNKKVLNINYDEINKFAEFLGLYMAEGHIQHGITLSFNVNEFELHELAKNLIKTCFGIDAIIYRKTPHKTSTQVKVYSLELEHYISEFFKGRTSLTKKLKDFVMFWPPETQLFLLRGWLKGDGGLWSDNTVNLKRKFIRSNNRNKFKLTGTSSSFELATQMYNISLRCGLHPSFKKRSNVKAASFTYDVYFTMKSDVEKILNRVINGRSCGRRFHKKGYLITRINKIEKEYYTGSLYDLTTTYGYFWCMGNVKVHNCDPPYVPLSKTANFTKYSMNDFTMKDQKKLMNFGKKRRNDLFLISNHDTDFIRDYCDADKVFTNEVTRSISSNKNTRGKIKEVLLVYEKKTKRDVAQSG